MNQDDVNGRVRFETRAGDGSMEDYNRAGEKLVKWIIVEDHRLVRPQ